MSTSLEDYKAQEAKRDAALADIGFAPAFDASNWMGMGAKFTTCQTCGATVHVAAGPDPESLPVFIHWKWHNPDAS